MNAGVQDPLLIFKDNRLDQALGTPDRKQPNRCFDKAWPWTLVTWWGTYLRILYTKASALTCSTKFNLDTLKDSASWHFVYSRLCVTSYRALTIDTTWASLKPIFDVVVSRAEASKPILCHAHRGRVFRKLADDAAGRFSCFRFTIGVIERKTPNISSRQIFVYLSWVILWYSLSIYFICIYETTLSNVNDHSNNFLYRIFQTFLKITKSLSRPNIWPKGTDFL